MRLFGMVTGRVECEIIFEAGDAVPGKRLFPGPLLAELVEQALGFLVMASDRMVVKEPTDRFDRRMRLHGGKVGILRFLGRAGACRGLGLPRHRDRVSTLSDARPQRLPPAQATARRTEPTCRSRTIGPPSCRARVIPKDVKFSAFIFERSTVARFDRRQ
jgi:hypothetical protein